MEDVRQLMALRGYECTVPELLELFITSMHGVNKRDKKAGQNVIACWLAGALCCECKKPLGFEAKLTIVAAGTKHVVCPDPLAAIWKR